MSVQKRKGSLTCIAGNNAIKLTCNAVAGNLVETRHVMNRAQFYLPRPELHTQIRQKVCADNDRVHRNQASQPYVMLPETPHKYYSFRGLMPPYLVPFYVPDFITPAILHT